MQGFAHYRSKKIYGALLWCWLALCLVDPTVLRAQVAAESVSREYQIKAVFLYTFAKFVDWPASTFANAKTPIRIGVLGDDPFGPYLQEAIAGEVLDGRELEIRYLARAAEGRECHILFISRSERAGLDKILRDLRTWSVLTVGDTEGFAQRGGMINLYEKDQTIRYEINLRAARQANIRISPKLLKLAKIVEYDNRGQ